MRPRMANLWQFLASGHQRTLAHSYAIANVILICGHLRLFEENWDHLACDSTCEILKPACHGWMARYQLWNIEGEPSQVVDIRIPLKFQEIWLQVCQSLRFEIGSGWKLSFPLAISKSCLQFVVLRTAFLLKPASKTAEAKFQSVTLAMDGTDHLRNIWSDAREGLKPFPCSRPSIPPELQRYRNSWYTFSICFSPSGRYILFTDFEFNMETHLIVWELVRGENLEVRQVASACHDIQQNSPIRHVALHPSEPLAIFCDRINLYRWTFFEGESASLAST